MMITVISLLCTAVFILIGVYVSCRMGASPNGNILLGVSLPNHELQNKAVIEIVQKYRRAYSLCMAVFLLMIVPIVFFAEHYLIVTTYFFVWMLALLYMCFKIVSVYFARLYRLKVENKWLTDAQRTIAIDTEVSRLKHTFMLSKKWFLIPLAMLAAPVVRYVYEAQEAYLWVIIITGLVILMMFFLSYLIVGKVRTKIYCEITEINLHLNHVFKSQWSRCMIILAILSSLFHIMLLHSIAAENAIFALAGTLIYCVVMFISIMLTHNKVKAERNRLLPSENQIAERDSDRYWIGGMIYNNPNDRSVFVEKRLGIGMTMNIGTLWGKLILAAIILLLAGTVAFSIWAVIVG